MTELEIIGTACLPETEIIELAGFICKTEDPANDYQICIKLVDSEEMRQFNRVYRGVEKDTDILSFVSSELPFCNSNLANPAGQDKPQSLKMCDIIIDINQLARQKGNKTLEEEFRIVLIHGLLHLVGYDHVRKQDACEMETKENYYLDQNKVKE
jgi:probable rRNA maturation factor